MAESIDQLKIYKSTRELEDKVYEIVKEFPADQFYGLGNDLRRSSAAVCHHVMGAHRLYSYRLKLDELAAMRREAEATQKHLDEAERQNYIDLPTYNSLTEGYSSVIKQSWGLTKWLKTKLEEKTAEK